MKLKILFVALTFFIPLLLAGCGKNQVAISPSPTLLPTSTSTQIPTSTNTATPTQTATPSPTPTPQTLGRIFPEGFHGQAVWSNAGGNASRNYADTGWHCPPPDYTSTDCDHLVIHFDISLPKGFGKDDLILSPVNGHVYNIYDVGGGAKSIQIKPEPGFAGVEKLLENEERIKTLAKGIFQFNYGISDVKEVSLHIAHVTPLVSVGDDIKKGDPLAKIHFESQPWNPKIVAFVIYIHMKDGTYWQLSPCDVPNEDEYCGKCASGTVYPCP